MNSENDEIEYFDSEEETDLKLISENKGNVLLEKPISNKADDKFNIYPYVMQLKEACDKGAVFIAVDGKFGSGKSSVVNLYENGVKNDNNVFVNINFMNINPNKDDTLNDYHRYFVNQVISDICKNPYEFERLFYNQRFSYTTINLKKNTKDKKIIDRVLLWLIGFISLYTIYGSLLDNENSIYHSTFDVATKCFPLVLLITFVLLVIYGYGFYKPDKNEQSPMLDTDKCRNNFLKAIADYFPKGGTLYLIIDDLDRVNNPELQLQIISLLFNEYYSLNNLVNDVSFKFIFMIDINKINNNYELQPKKMFDYILPISSNQKTILKHYIEKMIQENKELTKIFDIENSEYFIGLIIMQFKEMREIKHLLNKILTKSIYISNKKISFDSKQLITLCILTSIANDEDIAASIEYILNKVGESKVSDPILQIIEENVISKVIDKNYYIYIYNFIDESNLLSFSEETVIDIVINTEFNYITSEKVSIINEYLDSTEIRLNCVYDECYKYVGSNKRVILLGNKSFYDYMNSKGLIDKSILLDSYTNNNIYNFYNNLRETLDDIDRTNIIRSLNEKLEIYSNNSNDEEYDNLIFDFHRFIKNLKEYIVDFDIKDIMSVVRMNDDLYKLFNEIKKDGHSIIYDLIADNYISVDEITDKVTKEFVNEIKSKILEIAYKVEEKILQSKVPNDMKLYILVNEDRVFDEVEEVYKQFISADNFYITVVDLEKLLKKYGYSQSLDKYIILKLNDKNFQKGMVEFIKKYEFDLSDDVLEKLDSISTKYGYPKYYENMFKIKEYYKLLIYSKAINDNKFKLDVDLASNSNYNDAIFDVYKNMNSGFKKYSYSVGFSNKIVNEMDFSNITYNNNNFWKIDFLISSLSTYEKCLKVFDNLNASEMLSDYATYYKNNADLKDIKFLERLSLYASEMSPSIKGNITKAINKVKERVR